LNNDPRTPLQKIYNFLQINDRLATSGQPKPEQFSAIADAGYEMVLNLLPDASDVYLPGEEAQVCSLGLSYHRISVIWTAPTRENLDEFFEVMKQNQTKQLYVHCAANMRVSAFTYLWRVKSGEDPLEAEADMHDIWVPDGVWAEFIESSLEM
jgi:protein tyrosine phosphatase (PTP) superfamily phosphohydrolase (DUF442 family)